MLSEFELQFQQKKYVVKPLLSAKKIDARVEELANEINSWVLKNAPQETVTILIVLHGAILFASDLIRHFSFPTEIQTVRLVSYHGLQNSGKIECKGGFPDLAGKHVLVVEDIIDTGKSVAFLKSELAKMNVKSLKIAALLDKPKEHSSDLSADYTGFQIGKNFVIGYGLDLDGKYRNLPYVGELKEV